MKIFAKIALVGLSALNGRFITRTPPPPPVVDVPVVVGYLTAAVWLIKKLTKI